MSLAHILERSSVGICLLCVGIDLLLWNSQRLLLLCCISMSYLRGSLHLLVLCWPHNSIAGGIGVRANIHLGGGQTEFCPNGFSGGGGSSGKFSGIHILWGGGSSRNFPGSIFCGVAVFVSLTAVTDPKFVFFSR